jgi:hypothetical protein
MIPGRPWQAAGLLALLLGLSGCGYSLEQRIEALRAAGYSVEPREPKKPQALRRARAQPRTPSEDDTLHTGSINSVASQIEPWKPVPADHKRTPEQNSSEWVREQAEAAEKDRTLDRKIRGICRAC